MYKIYVKDQAQKQYAMAAMKLQIIANPNLNGADYEVEIDSDLEGSIDGGDALIGAALMHVVFERAHDQQA